ncbi:MAG: ABC transporter ATP-binding protein [Verrucomicrobiota bacterium]
MIELQDISKDLGDKKILQDVSLQIKRGETLVIVGSSGAGKSVTLKHITGLLTPDKGDVLVAGESLIHAHGRQREKILEKLGVLFQSGALINWMNIYENIALPLFEKTDLNEREIRTAVSEKLALVGLEGSERTMPAELSGGMRKRAALARAIIREPAIILYDEPTSGLDPILSRSIDDLIVDLQKRLGVTAIVVTHDLVSACRVGDRIAMLQDGRIVIDAPPDEFVASDKPEVRKFVEAQFSPTDVIQNTDKA